MQPYIYYNSTRIDYTITRRKRKTVGITISTDKGVQVLAPNRISIKQIEDIVLHKASWILKKLSLVTELDANKTSRRFVSGEKLLHLGKEYTLDVLRHDGKKSSFASFNNDLFVVNVPSKMSDTEYYNEVRGALVELYRQHAAAFIGERIKFYSERLNVKPSKVIIKEQKTRWGSCTASNVININWKIMMAPMEIIDYLVVHELAHIRVKNHSQNFWKLVESILPDYKDRRKWLKTAGQGLGL